MNQAATIPSNKQAQTVVLYGARIPLTPQHVRVETSNPKCPVFVRADFVGPGVDLSGALSLARPIHDGLQPMEVVLNTMHLCLGDALVPPLPEFKRTEHTSVAPWVSLLPEVEGDTTNDAIALDAEFNEGELMIKRIIDTLNNKKRKFLETVTQVWSPTEVAKAQRAYRDYKASLPLDTIPEMSRAQG